MNKEELQEIKKQVAETSLESLIHFWKVNYKKTDETTQKILKVVSEEYKKRTGKQLPLSSK